MPSTSTEEKPGGENMFRHSRGCAFALMSVGLVAILASPLRGGPPGNIDLEWRPQIQSTGPGQIIEVDLYAVATVALQDIQGVQAILDWDQTRLKLVGMKRPCGTCLGGTSIGLFCNEDSECPLSSCGGSDPCFVCPSSDTYNWFATTLPNDCDPGNGLNAPCPGFPANDGDAFYVAFVQVLCDGESAPPAPVTPAGFWVTTFLFEVLATDGGALVDMTLEFNTTRTLVAGANPFPGADLLRNIGPPAQINIIQCEVPASVEAAGPRYLEVIPAAGTTPVALQVSGDPSDPSVSCVTLYVQAPTHQCVGGSDQGRPCTDDVDCTDGICQAFAVLGPDVVKLTPAEWGTVYVHAADLHPSAFYQVRSDCGSVAGQTVSSAIPASLWFWGDTDNDAKCFQGTNAGNPCLGDADCPDSICVGVDFTDISNVVDGFKGIFSASLTLPQVDLEGSACEPNVNVNFVDISAAVDAFKSIPFNCTSPCP